MENHRITVILAIDLSAAFDTFDYQILTDVLNKRFSIEGVVLRVLKLPIFKIMQSNSGKCVLNRKIIISSFSR